MAIFQCKPNFQELKPVILDNEKLIHTEIVDMPIDFNKNIIQVLNYYGEEYHMEINTNKLMIKRKLFENKELLWNYTNKANDSLWLKNHLEKNND